MVFLSEQLKIWVDRIIYLCLEQTIIRQQLEEYTRYMFCCVARTIKLFTFLTWLFHSQISQLLVHSERKVRRTISKDLVSIAEFQQGKFPCTVIPSMDVNF